ncbi:MAG: hypothetical protein V7668_08045, partial [Cereibacter changlensis]
HNLAKVRVVSSNLIARSSKTILMMVASGGHFRLWGGQLEDPAPLWIVGQGREARRGAADERRNPSPDSGVLEPSGLSSILAAAPVSGRRCTGILAASGRGMTALGFNEPRREKQN